ncbi:MAG: ribonuclease HII [Deltaproteobacteria bacterium]|nr:ribonuclease HII [Deltaproteobacteria bacterium]
MNAGALEEEGYGRGFKCVAGLDEVGRGPWAGPVVAAAVILPREFLVSGFALQVNSKLETRDSKLEIKDSKLLTARKREALAPWIKENAVAWGLGIVSVEEIDKINILQASLLAMSLALREIRPLPDYLLIDGPHKIPLDFLRRVQKVQDVQNDLNDLNSFKPFEQMPYQRAIKKGDRLSVSIAAASIVAKVARDRMMVEYDRLYPEYGFGQHKGYGCATHLAALSRYGPSPIHRRSFKPVRERLGGLPDPLSLFLSPSKGEREG